MSGFYDWVHVLRFIQRKCDGTGDLTGNGDLSAIRQGRWVQKFPVHGDEAALRLGAVESRMSGPVERQLQDFNSGPIFQPSGGQHLSTENDGLPREGIRAGLDLKK